MPCLRMETGCRWRKKLVSITTTRLRRSFGAGWRNTLFQTCEPRMYSPTDMRASLSSDSRVLISDWRLQAAFRSLKSELCNLRFVSSHLHRRFGVGPLAQFELELLALVDKE